MEEIWKAFRKLLREQMCAVDVSAASGARYTVKTSAKHNVAFGTHVDLKKVKNITIKNAFEYGLDFPIRVPVPFPIKESPSARGSHAFKTTKTNAIYRKNDQISCFAKAFEYSSDTSNI